MIEYFAIEELVSRRTFNARGQKAWELLDWRALQTLEWLRENLGRATVNNWKWGGVYEQSGLREWEFYLQLKDVNNDDQAKKRYSGSRSQHKFGRGFDVKFADHTAEEVRQWIKENWEDSGFDWAITLEEGVSWLHFDVRNKPKNQVYTFNKQEGRNV